VGIRATGTLATTVINSGYIDGSNGDAVEFGDADGNVFAMTRQSGFGGLVQGGALTDTLQLTGPTPVKGIVWGIDSTFVGFENLAVTDGGIWRLAGKNTLPSGGTIALDGALEVTGRLTVNGTLNVVNPAASASFRSLDVTPGGIIEIGSAGTALPGRVTVDSDGHLVASGRIAGRVDSLGTDSTRVVNNGTITVAEDDFLFIQGKVTGSGTFELGHNSSLVLGDITAVRQFFLPEAGTNESITMHAKFPATPIIHGFADSDSIDILGFDADPALTTFASHILTLHENGGPGTLALHIAGSGYDLADFSVTPDFLGGTLITHI
jgi:hypothetical protein